MALHVIPGGPTATGALRPGRRVAQPRSNMSTPTPLQRATKAQHPSVPLYDRTADPDRPTMPLKVSIALSLLVRHTMNPVSVPRAHAVEAAGIVADWVRGGQVDGDPTPPHGTPRPVA